MGISCSLCPILCDGGCWTGSFVSSALSFTLSKTSLSFLRSLYCFSFLIWDNPPPPLPLDLYYGTNFSCSLSECIGVRKRDHGLSQTPLPLKDISFAFIFLNLNSKMETLVQLKNNPFLMGLCRSGPPPDLQYDNSSGTSLFYSLHQIYI